MGNGYIISPQYLERIKKFQCTFVKYFPQFEEMQTAAQEWELAAIALDFKRD